MFINVDYDVFVFYFRKAQEQNKKVVVAGCVPQAQPRMDYLKDLSIIGVNAHARDPFTIFSKIILSEILSPFYLLFSNVLKFNSSSQ